MTVFITQSNYIPWKGYFDAIRQADVFVLYDDMQYTKGDWRNRNKIKTPNGLQWLTIPVKVKGLDQRINETPVADQLWRKKHWKTIVQNYRNAPHFEKFSSVFEALYNGQEEMLSEINHRFIIAINEILGIETRVMQSSELQLRGDRNEKLVNICKDLGASTYLSGPAAKVYLDESQFKTEGIQVSWIDYSGYPEYPQLYGNFEHSVTVLDMIFNLGPESRKGIQKTA